MACLLGLTLVLQLPQARFLFLTHLLSALFLFELALSTLCLLLRPLLIRAFRGGTPQCFSGLVPARLAEATGFWNVRAADSALA